MMVMREDGDGKKAVVMTMYFVGVCPAGFLVVSQLCFGGRWCLGGPLMVCP